MTQKKNRVQKKSRRNLQKELFWRQTIQQRQESQKTVREFCRLEGLPETAYHYWRRELVKRDRENQAANASSVKTSSAQTSPVKVASQPKTKPASNKKPAFIPVPLLPETTELLSTSKIEVVLTSGQRVRVQTGFDLQTLEGLLCVLEGRTC